MYPFDPKNLVSNVMELIRRLREGEVGNGSILVLVGSIIGEAGVLLGADVVTSTSDDDLAGVLADLEAIASEPVAAEDPLFNIMPYIPLIIEVIKAILKRRGLLPE